ncbi:MAG: hypothetical protein B7X55_05755 [Rhodobacterales bacterium 34-62-10]|nr:MAG: hypothetical protein B7X55_05755 [Rhodobacterales bacterium 34-62-10]
MVSDSKNDLETEHSKLNEWGVPNWQDEKAYRFPSDWTRNRWRWEFYRRRNDLREYFDRWADKTYEENLECNEGRRPHDPGFFAYGNIEASQVALKEFGYSGIPNPRVGDQSVGSIRPFLELTKQQVRIVSSLDNETRYQGMLEDTTKQARREHEILLGPYEVALRFDLDQHIEPQIKRARQVLAKRQKLLDRTPKISRFHTKLHSNYLRVIDADDDGATLSEIAAFLPKSYGNRSPKTADNVLNQAREMQFSF